MKCKKNDFVDARAVRGGEDTKFFIYMRKKKMGKEKRENCNDCWMK